MQRRKGRVILEGAGFKYAAVKGLGKLPQGLRLGADVPGVATDVDSGYFGLATAKGDVIATDLGRGSI
jgi:hypothetical protein